MVVSTRRSFLKGAIVVVCAAPAFGACAPGRDYPPWSIPDATVLAPRHYAILCALADALLPGDAQSPGADLARAAWYIDRLLGAFGHDPPLIFAGGPYSGRHGGEDGFSKFQKLTRVEELRWRTYIEGSQGKPEREWNGPVKGLVDLYPEGLDAIDQLAQDNYDASYWKLDLDQRRAMLGMVPADFLALVFGHVVEGTWGDPVYGGNANMVGWQAISYEGDRQPVGFSAEQMAKPEAG